MYIYIYKIYEIIGITSGGFFLFLIEYLTWAVFTNFKNMTRC